MKVYVSGPMTGHPDYNFPAFAAAVTALTEAGYEVIDPSRHGADPAFTWADYLRRDLRDVLDAEILVVLPGWECSRGGGFEVHVAHQLGMTVLPLAAVTA